MFKNKISNNTKIKGLTSSFIVLYNSDAKNLLKK